MHPKCTEKKSGREESNVPPAESAGTIEVAPKNTPGGGVQPNAVGFDLPRHSAAHSSSTAVRRLPLEHQDTIKMLFEWIVTGTRSK